MKTFLQTLLAVAAFSSAALAQTYQTPIRNGVLQTDLDADLNTIINVVQEGSTVLAADATTGELLGPDEFWEFNLSAIFAAGDADELVIQPAGTEASIDLILSPKGSGGVVMIGDSSGDPVAPVTAVDFVSTPPTTPTSTGAQGHVIQSGNFLYICIATDTWRRIELLTW